MAKQGYKNLWGKPDLLAVPDVRVREPVKKIWEVLEELNRRIYDNEQQIIKVEIQGRGVNQTVAEDIDDTYSNSTETPSEMTTVSGTRTKLTVKEGSYVLLTYACLFTDEDPDVPGQADLIRDEGGAGEETLDTDYFIGDGDGLVFYYMDGPLSAGTYDWSLWARLQDATAWPGTINLDDASPGRLSATEFPQ